MDRRRLGPFEVNAIGLGCMNLSHAYGAPPDEATGVRVLNHALDLGYDHLDTAALYGFGANETLLGKALKTRRDEYVLASKCVLNVVGGKRVIDGRPEVILRTCDEALQRLQTDVIDLYYLHRWDKKVPIEDSMGAMKQLVEAGKIRAVGLSEVSAATLRKAHAVHPVSAVQTEYSLWTRNAEIAVLDACRDIGAAFVAFSPLARAFLCGPMDPAGFHERDIRRGMPRFQSPHFEKNAALLPAYAAIAEEVGCAKSQLALAWLLARGEHVVAIPGTTSLAHLEENWRAGDVRLSADVVARLDALINARTVSGPRYAAPVQAQVDTEIDPETESAPA